MIASAVLSICLLAHSQSGAKVTVRFYAIPVSAALEKISHLSGLALSAPRPLDSDLIFMRVKDADPARLMAVIAKTLDAKWLQHDASWILVPDDLAARHRVAEQYESEAETWRGSMAYLRKRLGTQPATYDQSAADAQRLHAKQAEDERKAAEQRDDFATQFKFDHSSEETPAWRAGARLLLTLDEGTVLKMPYRAKQVWAEAPTSMQSQMPLGAEDALAAYRRELAVYAPQAAAARVKLELNRWEDGGSFSAELTVQGPNGQTVDKARLRLANDIEILSKPGGHTFVPPKPKAGEKPIELPEPVKEQLAMLDVHPTAPPSVRSRWEAMLCEPAKYEPLRLLAGAEFVEAAEAADLQLVGTPDEQTVLRFSGIVAPAGPETPSQFFARMAGGWVDDGDGWRIARPARPIHRLSRELAGEIVRASVGRGGVTVDDAASWAGGDLYEFPFIDWLGDALTAIFPNSGPFSVIRTTGDEQGLRLWDALGSARSALREGQTLRISTLSPEAQEKIAEHVYWYDVFGGGDPTDLFPTGARDGSVSLTVDQKPVFAAWASDKPDAAKAKVFDSKVFGEMLATGSTWTKTPPEIYQAMNRFRIGVFRTYTLHFTILPGEKTFTVELSEMMMPPDSGVLNQLPGALADQLDASRKAALNKAATRGGGDAPPPR